MVHFSECSASARAGLDLHTSEKGMVLWIVEVLNPFMLQIWSPLFWPE